MSGQPPPYQDDPFSLLSEGPQAADPQGQDPFSFLAPAATIAAEEAQTLGESVGWGLLNAAKVGADNFAHAGTFVVKSLSGVESMLSGDGFDAGYESMRQQMLRDAGTTDPGMVELFESLARKFGVTSEMPHLGRQAEDAINKRLGKNRVFTDAIGNVLSFAPQTALTRGAVAAAPLMGNVAERQLARLAASKAGIARETIDPLISSGRAWEFIAQSPGWQKAAGILDHTMAAAGRNMNDLVGTTAANIAQSFAMAPDKKRLEGVKTAAIASPFMIPIARLGQSAARVVASNMLSADEAKVVGSVIKAFEEGDVTFPQMNAALRALTPASARILSNNVIAPAFEGMAFSGITPQFWNDYAAWQAGDPDALSRMIAGGIGNVFGVAAVKMGGRHDLAPLFKQIRPDLNTLSTYLEAEANKRAFEQPLAEKVTQEPQVRLQEPTPEGVLIPETGPPTDAATKALEEAAAGGDQFAAKELERLQSKWGKLLQERADAAASREKNLRELRENYGWAETPSLAMLRGGWDPEFADAGTVRLRFGRDHSVDLSRAEDGTPVLRFDPRIEEILDNYGIETVDLPAGRQLLSTGTVEYRGPAAKKALDDLALIGTLNRVHGALHFQRLGMREVVPGVYADSDGKYHTLQLDGKTATRNLEDSTWTGTDDLQSTGFPDGPNWTNETVEGMKVWLLQKQAAAPSPIEDSLLQNSISLAHNGIGRSADQLREFFSSLPPEALGEMLNGKDYRMLALEVGSIAAGGNNALHAANELIADMNRQRVARADAERLAQGSAFRQEGDARAQREAGKDLGVEEAVAELMAGRRGVTVERERGTSDTSLSEVRQPAQQEGAALLPPVPRGGDEGVATGESVARRGTEAGQRPELREGLPQEGQTDEGALRTVRGVGEPDAPQGLRPAADDPMALPGVPRGGAPETLSERLARLREDPGEATAGGVSRQQMRKLGRAARDVDEFLLETQPEVLRKAVPGEKLPFEIRRAISEGERMGDIFVSDFQPARRAIRTRVRDVMSPQERAVRRAVRKGVVESPTNPRAGYMRWEKLANREIEPQNEREREFVESAQKALRAAYEAQRKAGAVRTYPQEQGPPKIEGLRRSTKSVVPYQFTREFFQKLADPDSRRDTFEVFAGENPKGKMPQYVRGKEAGQWDYRGEGPVTADALEALYQKELQGKEVDSALRESAAEHFRMLQNVPHVIDGVKIRETDPFKAIEGSLRMQGRRAAALQQFGPDIPADAREAMLQEAALTGAVTPPVEAIQQGRLGVGERLARFREALSRSKAGRDPEFVMEQAHDLMVRAQGGNPEKLWRVTQSQAVQDFLGITNAAMAAGGFRWDLFEPIARTGAYAGYIRSAITMIRLLRPRNFREMAEQVDRWGAAERTVTDHLLDEITSAPARAIADAAQFIGSRTERWKQVFNAAIANQIVTGLRRGTGTLNDYQLLQDHLRLSAEDMQAVREGRMSDPLASQIRRELTSLFTSRGRPAEGSRFAASRNAALLTRFNRFATRRLEQSLKDVAATAAAIKRDGWASRGALTAATRMAKVSLGMAAGGMVGQAIAYMMTSWARGENALEGLLRLKREFTYAPVWTTAKAFGTQLVGGPMGQLINAAINNKDPQSIASVTIPGQLVAAVMEFGDKTIDAIGKKDWKGGSDALLDAVFDTGAVPFRGDVKALIKTVAAKAAAEDPQTVADAQIVREWRRFEGIQQPYGEKTKPPEFYDSISKVLSVARSMPNAPPKEIMQKGMDSIRAALALAPEESVAAAIEGHMLTRGLSDDQREKLHKWLGDELRIRRVYQHDAALKDLAAEARKLEGTYPTPFQQQLEQVRQQARFGGADRWRSLTERVVDESTQKLLAGDGLSSDIDDLAEAMSIYGEQVAPLFDERTRRFLAADHVDSTAKARRIAKILRERTLARRKETTREQNREANR